MATTKAKKRSSSRSQEEEGAGRERPADRGAGARDGAGEARTRREEGAGAEGPARRGAAQRRSRRRCGGRDAGDGGDRTAQAGDSAARRTPAAPARLQGHAGAAASARRQGPARSGAGQGSAPPRAGRRSAGCAQRAAACVCRRRLVVRLPGAVLRRRPRAAAGRSPRRADPEPGQGGRRSRATCSASNNAS